MPKKNTKLTTEEIQAVGEIQQGYQQIQSTIGPYIWENIRWFNK